MSKLLEFLSEPTPESYVVALDELCNGANYSPYSSAVMHIKQHLDSSDYQVVLDTVRGEWATLMLSTVAHHMAGLAAEKLGDEESVEFERGLSAVLLRCALGTGDGSRVRPYQLSVPWDAYALLAALKINPCSQALVRNRDRWLDVFTDERGHETTFDITRPFGRMRGASSGTKD